MLATRVGLFATTSLVLCALPVLGQEKPAGEKYALLVGVTRYVTKEFRPLPYAERDVTELAKILKENGYRPDNVVLLTQSAGADDPRFAPSTDRIREELRLLLKNRTENDSVLVAFAGHGVHFKNDTNSYFCPADGNLEERKNLISLSDLYKDLEKCPANLKVLMVDACRNDPFQDKTRRATAEFESTSRPAVPTTPGGVVAFFSCSEKEQAFEHDDLRHGVFFHYVIQGLKGGVGEREDITVTALGDYVTRNVSDFVRAKYGKAQTPEIVGKLRGLTPLVHIDEATRLLRRGKSQLERNELDRAVASLTAAIERNDGLPAAFVARGDAYSEQSEHQKATADYDAALRLDPTNVEAMVGRGWMFTNEREWDKAAEVFNKAIRRTDPKDAAAYTLRGQAYVALAYCGKGEYEKGIADLDQAIRLDPNYAPAYVHRSFGHYYLGDYDKVIADCAEIIRINPANAGAYNNRGCAHEQKGDHDSAIADLSEALRLNPKNATYQANRGRNYLEKGLYEKAVADLNEAARLDPKAVEAFALRGRAYREQGQDDKAIPDFNKAIELGSKDAWVYALRGDALYYKHEYGKAIADYSEAIKLDPEYVKPLKERGWTYYMIDKNDEALADLESVHKLAPDDHWAFNAKGLVYKEKKAYDKAIAAYTQAIRLQPENAIYYSHRGMAYLERDEFERAIDDFTAAISHAPKDATYYYNRGKAYARLTTKINKQVQERINARDADGASRLLEKAKEAQAKGAADARTAEGLSKKK